MSRLIMLLAVCVAVLGLAGLCVAADDNQSFSGNGEVYLPPGPPAPPGMRFGDVGHVMGGDVAYGGAGCPNCGFGVPGAYCDPCWRGPCMDWKVIGWYSRWSAHGGWGDGAGCAPCGSCR